MIGQVKTFVKAGRAIGVALTLACALAPGAARAEFSVCNQTLSVLNVAIGRFQGDELVTSGWWTIGPNQCGRVIARPLGVRYVYVFAKDVFGRAALSGAVPLCVAPERFDIAGQDDCLARGHLSAPFREVDTEESSRWSFVVYPP